MALLNASSTVTPLYVVNKDGQHPNNGDIFNQLFALVDSTIEHHRDDLLVHDANEIACMGAHPFIHVAYRSGTHLYQVPRTIKDNSRVKYLFDRERPSAIYTQKLDLLSNYFDRPDYFGYPHFFNHSDGTHVSSVSKMQAVDIYRTALTQVLRELRHSSQPTHF